MNCKICKKDVEHLEKHHIVPKSRGGSDDESNLIMVCNECHGLAHDVSFSNKRGGGLIKEKIKEKNELEKQSRKWLDKNEHLVLNKMNELYQEDEDKHMLTLLLLEMHKIQAYHLADWVLNGKMKIKVQLTY
jgi:GTPase involved in cell partitioning and DNA repair